MKNAVVVCPDGSNQIMDIDMSAGISVDLFGTKTNFEVKASKLSGFLLIYYGMDTEPMSINNINPTGMAWMPPHDDTFVKKNGKVTDDEYQKIFNKRRNDAALARHGQPQTMMCCSIL